ncbi:MAG: LamG-like jellyroll fold domain-containing protein [Kofleriaceae bacterium]
MVVKSLVPAIVLAGCGFRVSVTGTSDGSSTEDAAVVDADPDAPPDARPIDAPPPMLVDRGLVVRYFIDEAASGQPQTLLVDSAPTPISLPITYGEAQYVETTEGHRGLQWAAVSGDGKIEQALSGKLFTRLTNSLDITIEVVVQITASGSSGSESQITGLRGSNPDFMLTALNTTDLRFFRPFGTEGATWTNANMQQRMVLHLVYDTSLQNANSRIELFRDGSMLVKTTGSVPMQNTEVNLGSSDALMIGNRQNQDRSINGTIFYVAYYDVALTATEIMTNTERLLANDDQ